MRRYCLRLALLSLTAIAPIAVYGDDQQIAQQIVEKLQAEKKAGTLKAFSIDLQVDEGTVWLSGRVASEQQQARALDLARRVPGVKQVVNDLLVNAPAAKPAVVAKPAAPAPAPSFFAAQQTKPAPAAMQAAVPSISIPATLIESPKAIPAMPIEPASEVAAEVELPQAPATVAATPIAAQPIASQPIAAEPSVEPRAEDFGNAPAIPLPVVQKPAANPQPAKHLSLPERRSAANNSVLNSVSKTLMTAVHGSKPAEESRPSGLQTASATQDVAKAIGAAPIGSGIDINASSRRESFKPLSR